MAVAAISTLVEWYDFTLYLYQASVLGRVFFGGGARGLTAALGGFALAYLMRPLGAAVFGRIGDRRGRRRAMLLSMQVMMLAMLVTGLLPTPAQIGPAAGFLLVSMRCVMGFSVGGEYNSVIAYLLEGAPVGRRGLITAGASVASELGGLLAVGVVAFVASRVDFRSLDAWGWRIPYFVGAILAGGVWGARSTLVESPDFRRQQAGGAMSANPLRDAFTDHTAGVARAFAISALGSISYYVGITYVPAFLISSGELGERAALALSTLAAVAVIVVSPVVGAIADCLGRKPVLTGLTALSAVLPIALFAMMTHGAAQLALLGAVGLACVAGGVSAVGAVATAEQFPGEGRLCGLAVSATTATALFGGLTPYVAQVLIARTGWPLAPGAMIAVTAACVLPVLVLMPETHPGRRLPDSSA